MATPYDKEAFKSVVNQINVSGKKVFKGEVVVTEDPQRPEYLTFVYHPDGRLKFKPCLGITRYKIVADIIQQFIVCGFNVKKVVDLGCSDKSFLMHGLLEISGIREVVCLDQHLSKLVEEKQLFQQDEDRRALSLHVQLIEANVLDIPRPISQPHVVTLIEVIEHFQVTDLPRLLWIVFSLMQPKVFIVTTPNTDFNKSYPLPEGKKFRHHDHKFEWSKVEFEKFCEGVTKIYPNYSVVFDGCGYGVTGHYCSQIAVFCSIDYRLFLKGERVQTTKGSIVEKVLSVSNERYKELQRKKTSGTDKVPDGESCPVPFPSPDQQGRELNENETDINDVLSELHLLVQKQSAEPETESDSIMSESGTAPSKQEQTMSTIVETEGAVKREKATPMDASMLKLSLKTPVIPPTDLPTPESPCTTTPVAAEGSSAHFNSLAHFTDKYRTVQDITYADVETLYMTAMMQEIGRFVWCCSSTNEYYPFTDKIEKCTGPWNYLKILDTVDGNNKPVKKRLLPPFIQQCTVSFKARKNMPKYDDENDGACYEDHRDYKKSCEKCPFLYIKKSVIPDHVNPPKVYTTQGHQNNVVYENFSKTKLWFSFDLLHRYLGVNDEKTLRKVLSKSNNYKQVTLKSRDLTCDFDYYYCVIGEGEDKVDRDADSDGGDDGATDSRPSSSGYTRSQGSLPSTRGGSSMSTAPSSPAHRPQAAGKRARGKMMDSLNSSLETQEADPQEGKHESQVQLKEWLLNSQLSTASDAAGGLPIETVPHRLATVGSVEWTVAHATAMAFGAAANIDTSVLTEAILCALVSLADVRAACASAEPADRYHAIDFHGQSKHGNEIGGLHTVQLGSPDTITADVCASSRSASAASSEKLFQELKHSSLVDVKRAPTIGAQRTASSVTARLRSSVAASSSARGPLVAASSATNPTSGVARVPLKSARGGPKPLNKSRSNVSSFSGPRVSSTAARTTASTTRTTNAATSRTASSSTRPLVVSAASTARTAVNPADRGIKVTSHRLSQASSSRVADSASREVRAPTVAPAHSASKASLSSRKVVSDKNST